MRSDGRRATGDGRRATGDGRRATGDGRRATGDPWLTFVPHRTVLAVTRTVTSTTRLLDALELFRGDFRVQVVFVVDPGSEFTPGVHELLADVGATTLTWDDAAKLPIDLVVSASENVHLGLVDAPVVVVPHGVGFQKFVPAPNGRRVSGLVPEEARQGLDLRTAISHPAQAAQVATLSPGAAAQTVVTGDICFDRLRASRRLRTEYRRALGVDDRQTLVLLSSTWRPDSLWGRHPTLPMRLLAELPADDYRVAMVIHPNVWSRHSPWQVRAWLADACAAGLRLIPPTDGWQATLVASDVVVGDHGSVTLYAAALGLPVLLGPPSGETVPGTPLAELTATAPRFDADRPLRAQLREARAVEGALDAFDHVGDALPRLRALLYERLDLDEPPGAPPLRAWPVPRVEVSAVRAFAVRVDVEPGGVVRVDRRPALLAEPDDRTLAVYDDELDLGLLESASLVVRTRPIAADEAEEWIRRSLRRFPGANAAAAPIAGGCVVATRSGAALTVRAAAVDPLVLASIGLAVGRGDVRFGGVLVQIA